MHELCIQIGTVHPLHFEISSNQMQSDRRDLLRHVTKSHRC